MLCGFDFFPSSMTVAAETMPCRQTIKSASNKNYKHDRLIYCQETFFSLHKYYSVVKKVFGEHYKHMAEEKCDFSSLICTAVDKMGWGENIIIQLLDQAHPRVA